MTHVQVDAPRAGEPGRAEPRLDDPLPGPVPGPLLGPVPTAFEGAFAGPFDVVEDGGYDESDDDLGDDLGDDDPDALEGAVSQRVRALSVIADAIARPCKGGVDVRRGLVILRCAR